MTILEELFEAHLATVAALRKNSAIIERIGEILIGSFRTGATLYLCGNGGSAADAQHIATEFACRYESHRIALPAIALTTDTSMLTATGNDFGFERIFARQIEALARPSDVLVCISTSGNSPNILAAAHEARARDVLTIGLLGKDGGPLRSQVDHALVVPSDNTARIQECHILIGHIWCAMVDRAFRQ